MLCITLAKFLKQFKANKQTTNKQTNNKQNIRVFSHEVSLKKSTALTYRFVFFLPIFGAEIT